MIDSDLQPLVAGLVSGSLLGLWSLWMGGLTGMLGVVLLLRVAGLIIAPDPAMLARVLPILRPVLGAIALVSGTAIWLTFCPPPSYRRRLIRATS